MYQSKIISSLDLSDHNELRETIFSSLLHVIWENWFGFTDHGASLLLNIVFKVYTNLLIACRGLSNNKVQENDTGNNCTKEPD